MLLFLVLAEKFRPVLIQILCSYTLLLKLPVLIRSCDNFVILHKILGLLPHIHHT